MCLWLNNLAVPLAGGGTDGEGNVLLSSRPCNLEGGSVIMLQETNWFGQRGTAALYWRGGCREVISLHADPKQPHFPSRTCSQIQTGGVFSPRLLEFDGKTFPLCLPKQWNNTLELNDFHENVRIVAASFHTSRQNPKMEAYGTVSLHPPLSQSKYLSQGLNQCTRGYSI